MPTKLGKSYVEHESLIPKVNFKVDMYAVLFSAMANEIRVRNSLKKNPELKESFLRAGILNLEWSKEINRFAKENRDDFVTSKLFSRVELIESLVPFASKVGTGVFESQAKARMEFEYGMSEEEIEAAMRILSSEKLGSLTKSKAFDAIMFSTNSYKRKMENGWNKDSKRLYEELEELIGKEEIEDHRDDKNRSDYLTVLVMPPNIQVQRIPYKTRKEAVYCLSIPGEDEKYTRAKTNGTILHALLQEVMVPNTNSMTGDERSKQHAFVKYMADKNTGLTYFQDFSIFDFSTPNEDIETMGRLYPAYLGYKYRRLPKEQAAERIRTDIDRDMRGLSRIKDTDKKSQLSKSYRLDELDPEVIAETFRNRYFGARSFSRINLQLLEDKMYGSSKRTPREEPSL